MLKAVDLRKGKTIIYEGSLYIVHECAHVAKGNKRSYMQAKLKEFKSGVMTDVRFTVDERIEVPFVESKEYEYLYQDGSDYVLMDQATFDQIHVSGDLFGDGINYLIPNTPVTCELYEDKIISITLPNSMDLTVTDTPPVVKGSTATNQPKDAVLETGARVRVPAFIEPGEKVRVDTRTGEYIERAK